MCCSTLATRDILHTARMITHQAHSFASTQMGFQCPIIHWMHTQLTTNECSFHSCARDILPYWQSNLLIYSLSCRCHTNVSNFHPMCCNVITFLLGDTILDKMAVPLFFCWQAPPRYRLIMSVLYLGRADNITVGISWTLDVSTDYHQNNQVRRLLILSTGTSAATAAPPQTIMPTLLLLLPLLNNWQQQQWHSMEACGGAAVAAMVAVAVAVAQWYCFASSCCHSPSAGHYPLLPPLLPLLKQWEQRRQSWHGGLWRGSSSSSQQWRQRLQRWRIHIMCASFLDHFSIPKRSQSLIYVLLAILHSTYD